MQTVEVFIFLGRILPSVPLRKKTCNICILGNFWRKIDSKEAIYLWFCGLRNSRNRSCFSYLPLFGSNLLRKFAKCTWTDTKEDGNVPQQWRKYTRSYFLLKTRYKVHRHKTSFIFYMLFLIHGEGYSIFLK